MQKKDLKMKIKNVDTNTILNYVLPFIYLKNIIQSNNGISMNYPT